MRKLAPEDLERPTIAGYYGMILQATGQPAEAVAFLDRGTNTTLLPEERRLFEGARAGL